MTDKSAKIAKTSTKRSTTWSIAKAWGATDRKPQEEMQDGGLNTFPTKIVQHAIDNISKLPSLPATSASLRYPYSRLLLESTDMHMRQLEWTSDIIQRANDTRKQMNDFYSTQTDLPHIIRNNDTLEIVAHGVKMAIPISTEPIYNDTLAVSNLTGDITISTPVRIACKDRDDGTHIQIEAGKERKFEVVDQNTNNVLGTVSSIEVMSHWLVVGGNLSSVSEADHTSKYPVNSHRICYEVITRTPCSKTKGGLTEQLDIEQKHMFSVHMTNCQDKSGESVFAQTDDDAILVPVTDANLKVVDIGSRDADTDMDFDTHPILTTPGTLADGSIFSMAAKRAQAMQHLQIANCSKKVQDFTSIQNQLNGVRAESFVQLVPTGPLTVQANLILPDQTIDLGNKEFLIDHQNPKVLVTHDVDTISIFSAIEQRPQQGGGAFFSSKLPIVCKKSQKHSVDALRTSTIGQYGVTEHDMTYATRTRSRIQSTNIDYENSVKVHWKLTN